MSGAVLPLEGRRLTVTGGNGFLGRHVRRELEARHAAVSAPSRAEYDLTRQADVARLYADTRPSVLVHLAAAAGGIGANVANPGRFLYENAVMGLMLLEEGRRAGIDRFVLVSTTCAYPRDAPLPLRETSLWDGPPVGATGPYGMAKRLLHEACRTYHEQYGLESAVLLPANLYGPEDHFDEARSHVVPALIRRYVEATEAGAEEVVNWGTGSPTREFLYVTDAARGIALAAQRLGDAAPVNLGTGVETSIRELSETVARVVGFPGRVAWDPEKPDGQPRRFLDVTRARERMGFEAEVDLREGLERTVRWYLQNRGGASGA